MNTKSKALVIEQNAIVGHSLDQLLSDKGHEVITTLKAANDTKKHSLLKTAGMLIAAPFIALGYVIALPIIGFYQIVKLAYEAFTKRRPGAVVKFRKAGLFARNVGLFFASPFIALGYIIALPFVGFTMFTKLALEARAKKSQGTHDFG